MAPRKVTEDHAADEQFLQSIRASTGDDAQQVHKGRARQQRLETDEIDYARGKLASAPHTFERLMLEEALRRGRLGEVGRVDPFYGILPNGTVLAGRGHQSMTRAPSDIRFQGIGYPTISRRQQYVVDDHHAGVILCEAASGNMAGIGVEGGS
ncbi:hypothetical protein [Rhizorhabdus sp. FW153]|uniref:hypothetical protein n=1 Tax=Rhizorhabdus sp. FW153 TaxID=3400216 RepID=UPI003CEFA863